MKPRIVLTESLYHQPVDGQPCSSTTKFSRWVDSEEEPFSRTDRAVEEWLPLDSGWLEGEVGQLSVANNERWRGPGNPTEEQKAAVAERVLQLGLHVDLNSDEPRDMHSPPKVPVTVMPFAKIRPGESLRIEPCRFDLLRVRCLKGAAKYGIVCYPR